MRILLTGVTGFIGQDVYKRLMGAHEVFLVVRKASDELINRFSEATQIIEWDLSVDDCPVSVMPNEIDCVMHLAQSRQYQNFPDQGPDVVGVNVTATARLLDYAAKSGVKHFCHVSSGSVYEPYDKNLSEDDVLTPNSINGCTNAAAEMLVLAYGKIMKVNSLRLFMPYGPGQVQRLLPNLIHRVSEGIAVDLAGGIGLTMSPLYIDDVSKVLIQAALEGWEGMYNVAGTEAVTLRDIVELIASTVGTDLIINENEGSPLSLVPPIDKLSEKYDLSSHVSFAEGLRVTVDAYRDAN